MMPCHESIKHRGDTLANYFAAHCPGTVFRCVNRLDRDTSGCVVVAKSRFCANALQKSCDKVYIGICKDLSLGGGRICAPVAREKESIIKRCVRTDGQYAATNFFAVQRHGSYCLCRFVLETGRTHQIRCHMAHIGHALVGDDMYGEKSELIQRQALHCAQVTFTHPVTHEKLTISAPLPNDMKRIMDT
jgi:23S rRNA pseudouridine1911/1915/1917 synthase